jgi:hypothetical protein
MPAEFWREIACDIESQQSIHAVTPERFVLDTVDMWMETGGDHLWCKRIACLIAG